MDIKDNEKYFETQRLWRNEVVEKLKHESCDISSIIEDIKIIPKNSSSNSIIVFGKIKTDLKLETNDRNIVIKISFNPISKLNNSLIVEQQIYKNIITNLVNNKHTPNLISYLGDIFCTSNSFKIPESEVDNLKDSLQETDSEFYDMTKYNLLILEKALNEKTLVQWFDDHHTSEEVLSVILQILYTLVCFNNIGLIHNDLHPGNIFVEDTGRKIPIYLKYDEGKYIKLETRYIPKIYDFDRGSIIHPAVNLNTELDIFFCNKFKTCNIQNEKFDMFQFVAILYQNLLNFRDDLLDVKKEIKTKWLLKILQWNWYLPYLNNEDRDSYVLNETTTDDKNFNNSFDILTKFIEADFKDKPWIFVNEEKNIPQELLFKLPQKTKLVQELYSPESKDTHMSLSGSVPIIDSPDPNIFFKNTANMKLLLSWFSSLKILKIETNKITIQLFNELVSKKHLSKISPYYNAYYIACYILTLPMYHMLDNESKKEFAIGAKKVDLNPIINDIWNIFNNRLPVSLVRFSRR